MSAHASPRATALAAAVRLRSTPAVQAAIVARRLARVAKQGSGLLSAPPSLPNLDLSVPDEGKEAARR